MALRELHAPTSHPWCHNLLMVRRRLPGEGHRRCRGPASLCERHVLFEKAVNGLQRSSMPRRRRGYLVGHLPRIQAWYASRLAAVGAQASRWGQSARLAWPLCGLPQAAPQAGQTPGSRCEVASVHTGETIRRRGCHPSRPARIQVACDYRGQCPCWGVAWKQQTPSSVCGTRRRPPLGEVGRNCNRRL